MEWRWCLPQQMRRFVSGRCLIHLSWHIQGLMMLGRVTAYCPSRGCTFDEQHYKKWGIFFFFFFLYIWFAFSRDDNSNKIKKQGNIIQIKETMHRVSTLNEVFFLLWWLFLCATTSILHSYFLLLQWRGFSFFFFGYIWFAFSRDDYTNKGINNIQIK